MHTKRLCQLLILCHTLKQDVWQLHVDVAWWNVHEIHQYSATRSERVAEKISKLWDAIHAPTSETVATLKDNLFDSI